MANRYAVLGSFTWDNSNTVNWSTSSGGAGGASAPTSSDNVFFDGGSDVLGAGFTVTFGTGWACADLTVSGLDAAMVLAGSTAGTIYGSVSFPATNFTRSFTSALTLGATATGKTILMNGTSLASDVTLNGVGGGWTLQDAFTTTGNAVLTAGALAFGAYSFSCATFNGSGTTTRSLDFGAGNITVTGSGTVFNLATQTNFSLSGTPLVIGNNGVAGGDHTYTPGTPAEANTISFWLTHGGVGGNNFTAGSNIKSLTIDGTDYSSGNINIYGGLVFTSNADAVASATATFTMKATSGTHPITSNGKTSLLTVSFNGVGGTWQLQDDFETSNVRQVDLTNGTIDFNNRALKAGFFDTNNSNARTLAFGASGKLSLSGSSQIIFTSATSTNLTVTGTPLVEFTYSGSTGTRTVTPGTANTEAQAISFSVVAGSDIIVITTNSIIKNLNLTGFSGSFGANRALVMYGNLTIPSGVTLPDADPLTFKRTSGTSTIITNGLTINRAVVFDGAGGTFALGGALTLGAYSATLTNGTLNQAGYTQTAQSYVTATGTKNHTFNGGNLTITGSGATAFNNAAPTNYTTTAGSGNGVINMASASAKTFVGGGSTFAAALNQGGAGALTLTGSNTLAGATNTTQPASVLFTAGTTTTFTVEPTWAGTSGNLITIGSVTASGHTLSKASGTVSVSYTTISRSTATGGATWRALLTNGNVDGGNNSGWAFIITVIISAVSATAATVAKGAAKRITASSATVAAVSKSSAKAIATSSATAATVAKIASKTVTATSDTVATVSHLVAKLIAATSDTLATVATLLARLQTINSSSTTTATLARQPSKIIAGETATSATVSKQQNKTVAATSDTSATVTRLPAKIIMAASATAALVAGIVQRLQTINSSSATSATVIKQTAKTVTAEAATSGAVTKQATKTIAAQSDTSATVARLPAKIITAVVATVALVGTITQRLLTINSSSTATATVTRQPSKFITAAVATTATLARGVTKIISATVATVATLGIRRRMPAPPSRVVRPHGRARMVYPVGRDRTVPRE